MNPEWQWNYQPRADGWSLTDRPGFLRLHAYKPIAPGNFFKVPDVLEQRYLGSDSDVVTVKLDLSGMSDGQEAGLAHFNGSKNEARLGIVQASGTKTLQYDENYTQTVGPALPKDTNDLWLRSTIDFDGIAHFAYSTDGKTFFPYGGPYKLKPGNYRGDMIGLYTFNNKSDSGYIDIDFFHYEVNNRPPVVTLSPSAR